MKPTMAELAAALIQVFEGCMLTAYRDSGGVLTIGVGHTGGVAAGQIATPQQVAQWFADDLSKLLAMAALSSPLTGAALVSFGYNCGASNLAKALLDPAEVLNPVHTTDRHGTVLPGLVARRRLEYLLTQYDSAAF